MQGAHTNLRELRVSYCTNSFRHVKPHSLWFTFIYKTLLGLTALPSSLYVQKIKNGENLHLRCSSIVSFCWCLWPECSPKETPSNWTSSFPALPSELLSQTVSSSSNCFLLCNAACLCCFVVILLTLIVLLLLCFTLHPIPSSLKWHLQAVIIKENLFLIDLPGQIKWWRPEVDKVETVACDWTLTKQNGARLQHSRWPYFCCRLLCSIWLKWPSAAFSNTPHHEMSNKSMHHL